MSTGAVAELRSALPDEVVVTDAPTIELHSSDMSGIPAGRAVALVRPRSTQDVSTTLAIAHRTGTPVVPQGARSGLAGSATAIEGSILLDLSGMDRIVRIDERDRAAIVQPGVIVADLQAAVESVGLFYAPDPASADRATIGGTIATNAGGMRCIKYGVTRDSVRSLEVVLADGTITRTRSSTVKGVTGLDLTSLIVGSEGTLAVVTEATLSLLPAPGEARGVTATFGTIAEAFAAADDIASGSRIPSTLEFLDGIALQGVRQVQPELAIPRDATAWLVAVTDARSGAAEDLEAFEAAFRAHRALTITRAETREELAVQLTARRALSPALGVIRGGATHGDLAVPRSRLRELAALADELSAETGLPISLSGHIGDGNLHPTVIFDPEDPAQVEASHTTSARLHELAQAVGGTISGEHGIGVVKLGSVDGEIPARLREIQRGIKAVFDPKGILNPGRKL